MKSPNGNFRRTALRVECLESRDNPAQFGIPWNDPRHLTLSFAPDGTTAAGVSSSLNTALDAQMPRSVWRTAFLRAAQTWSNWADLNIGIVADGGEPFGSAGPTQSDARYGDIRIAAVPMAGDTLAEAIPPDSLLAGSYSGDIFINSEAKFTPKSLYSVALHEIGHALGVDSSPNRLSVMSDRYAGRFSLLASDVSNIRALYGAKPPDAYEGKFGNRTFRTAAALLQPQNYEGSTPLVAFGELSTRSDVDYYKFQNLADYSGAIEVQIQSAGISMVGLRVSLYDSRGRAITTASSTAIEGDTYTLNIPSSSGGSAYYVRIDAAPGGTARIGRYGLAVTFVDRVGGDLPLSVDRMLRGPFDNLSADSLAILFDDPNNSLYNDDNNKSATFLSANVLAAIPGSAGTRFATTASFSSLEDGEFFRIRSPKMRATLPSALTVSVRAIGPHGTTPRIEVFDANDVPVAAEVLVNGNGTYSIQVIGIASNRTYSLRVANAPEIGNFQLEARFGSKPAAIQTFSEGTIPAGSSFADSLYVARTQLFGFSLMASGPAGASVRVDILNELGNAVYSISAPVGETISGISSFLPPGAYSISIVALAATGPVTYSLRGAVASDPIGPQPSTSTLAPKYANPANPKNFLYPNGQVSFDPYLWLLLPRI